MKNLLFVSLFLCLVVSVFAMMHTEHFQNAGNSIHVFESRADALVLEWSVGGIVFTEKTIENLTFTTLNIDGFLGNHQVGLPELPFLGRLITVPLNAEIRINYLETRFSEVSLNELGFLNPIYPAQPSYSKSADSSEMVFQYDTQSYRVPNYDEDFRPFRVSEAGFMRGQRIFEVAYTPVQYNPVENTIKVHSYLKVELLFENADFAQTEYMHQKTWSADFEKVFQTNLLNYTSPANRSELMRYPTKYVIVSFGAFVEAMQVFADWKTKAGYDVILASTTDPAVGGSNASIKNYLQGLWDAATPTDPAPTYLLLVGDTPQIAPFPGQTTPSDHITDLHFVRLQGSSFFPDMYYGRFSARNLDELLPQINKTIEYQHLTMPDTSYLGRSVNIAGWDSVRGVWYCNSQMNYLGENYMNSSTPHNNYTTVNTFLNPDSRYQSDLVKQKINEGAGWVNFSAHGNWNLWADPYVYVADIDALTNHGMYSFAMGNTCLSGKFDQPHNFAEAWLRHPSGGGIIYIGASNSTYWDQDFYFTVSNRQPNTNGNPLPYDPTNLGGYDMLFHANGESVEQWHTTAGALVYGGNMVVQRSSSAANMKNHYWEIYHIMGDPSLAPYLGIPAPNNAVFTDTILMGQTQIDISNTAPFARIAISVNGVLHGVAFADDFGDATLYFEPFYMPGEALLVIIAQNHEPVLADIQIISADLPFLVFNNVTNQATGNNSVDFDRESNISITVENIGLQPATDVIFELSTSSEFINILESNIHIANIPPQGIYELEEMFLVDTEALVEDQTIANFVLKATDNSNDTWMMTFSLYINAPNIIQKSFVLLNEMGDSIENPLPGETTQMIIVFENVGKASSYDGTIMLVSTNPLVTINQSYSEIVAIGADAIVEYDFLITVDESTPKGALTSVSYFANFDSHKIQSEITLPIGRVIESFETGDFSYMEWQNNSASPWIIDSENVFKGIYSARSGTISNNQTSILSIPYSLEASGQIKFAVKTSSEATHDPLQFYFNNMLVDSWSGETDWTEVEYDVPAGDYLFRWVYRKNGSDSEGLDCAWIDYIIFPSSGGGNILGPVAGVTITEIDFGSIQLGDKVSAKFNLVNFGNLPLYGNILLPEPFHLDKASNFYISPFDNNDYEVLFESEVDNVLISEQIVIESNDTNNPTIIITVTVLVGTLGDDGNETIPALTRLYGNFPNPFNPETNIRFSVHKSQNVEISIYNIKGQLVKQLVNDEFSAGVHDIIWNGRDHLERGVASGIYFYRLKTADTTQINRMLLMK